VPATPDKINETTEFIWKVFSGQELQGNVAGFGPFVDVRDVARLVVFGVEHGQEANEQRYLAVSGWITPQAAADILRKAYPGRRDVISEGEPHSNYLPDFKCPPQAPQIDASKAVKATGQGWLGVDAMILDAAKAFEVYL
jgi:nucleoside-diphosphate-sugar epimerase